MSSRPTRSSSASSALSDAAQAAPASPASSDIKIGARIMCRWRDGTEHAAEVIEIRSKGARSEYYVTFIGENRRLDEWVTQDRICAVAAADSPAVDEGKGGRQTRNQKRRHDELNHTEEDDHAQDAVSAALEKEHLEATKVKNIMCIQIGNFDIDTWYYSPYPEDFAGVERLYLCEFCLKYMRKLNTLERHMCKCELRHPPGDEIYRDGRLSVFEVDGRKNKIYCQNLCLLSKLFLDHKTLYYDVDPFLFYILTERDERGCQLVGYFSKEKDSPQDHNLACIMTMPQHQRKGYGRFLIAMSYELSRKEGRVGTPERPLSDLGKLSYRSFWRDTILDLLAETTQNKTGSLSVNDIRAHTMIKSEDIITTLQSLNLIKYYKQQHLIYVTPQIIAEHQAKRRSTKGPALDQSKLHWAPPLTMAKSRK